MKDFACQADKGTPAMMFNQRRAGQARRQFVDEVKVQGRYSDDMEPF